MQAHSLPIARYRFTAIARQPLKLPDYAGSLLRGQFGAALRNLACMTRQPTCGGCPLIQTCPYTRIFEAPPPPKGAHALQDFSQVPNPYVIEPPEPGAAALKTGDALVFHVVLIGHALDQLALVVFALQRALAHGLTQARAPLTLEAVEHLPGDGAARHIWHVDAPTLLAHEATLTVPELPIATDCVAVKPMDTGAEAQKSLRRPVALALNIRTPLRLQHQGQPLRPDQLSPRALVAALARRHALLLEMHAGQGGWGEAAKAAARAAENLTDERELRWHDWVRYSSRQKQEMTLGGVLGRWTLQVPDPEALALIWHFLWLGQWLHVGKNATMGLGQYTLEVE